MSTQSKFPDERTPIVAALLILLFVLMAILLVSGCSPRIMEHIRTEKEYIDRWHEKTDSVYVKDSIFIREKNDTVYIDRWHERWRTKTETQHDTLLREVHDTTTVPVPVEEPLSAWKSAKLSAFWWLVGALVAALLYIFRKPLLKLLKLCIPL